jgi:hypothetical protein
MAEDAGLLGLMQEYMRNNPGGDRFKGNSARLFRAFRRHRSSAFSASDIHNAAV